MQALQPTPRSERRLVAALSVTETVSWGVLYYAFSVFLVPMREELGLSTAQLTGAFSLALLVAGAAGILVGRHLDRHGPRALMTAGSLAGVLAVLAWSRVDSLAAMYAVWLAIGLIMATVLYEPAFTVLAKAFSDAGERRRAMTALTLVAALSSFIFLPLSQALVDLHGWRQALVDLAVVLLVVTVPLHALALPRAAPAPEAADGPAPAAGAVVRSAPFWLLAVAFFLATATGIGVTVLAIPLLVERGHDPAFAAFAVGLVGAAQIPGRLLFAPLGSRLRPGRAAAAVCLAVGAGIALIALLSRSPAVVVGLVVLGMGNGMATLARATSIADLYGAAAYGAISGTAAALTTGARALGPAAAALLAAAFGFDALLWLFAAISVVAAVLAAWHVQRPIG